MNSTSGLKKKKPRLLLQGVVVVETLKKVIAELLKMWLMKIRAISLQQTRTRLFVTPNSPKITDKREISETKREQKHQ